MSGSRITEHGARLAALAVLAVAMGRPAEPQDRSDARKVIDKHIKATWDKLNLKPARPAADDEFLRRVMLDLTGTVPNIDDVEKFLSDRSASKREKKIDVLLNSRAFSRYWAHLWTVTLLGWFQDFNFDGYNREEMREWLEEEIRKGVPWNRVCLALLSASGAPVGNPAANFGIRYLSEGAEAFTTRVVKTFLGIRLNCAQCHDHPFDVWKREDFYGLAAFVNRTTLYASGRDNGFTYRLLDVTYGDGLQPEGFNAPVPPRFINGAAPVTGLWRQEFALYVTRYPQFARAMVNRVWTHLMGRGIVHTPDNFGKKNKPSHPELLEELTRDFIASGYDLKHVVRSIVNSRAYQLSSENAGVDPLNEKYFVCAIRKPLSPYQLWNAVTRANGHERTYGGDQSKIEAERDAFTGQFADGLDGDATDANQYAETSQNLMTKLTTDFIYGFGTPEEHSIMTRVVGEAQPARRVELLYLALLGRHPSDAERKIAVAHINAAPPEDPAAPVRDLFFALVSSHEFNFNH